MSYKIEFKEVVITLSDPWDLGESLDWKPQKGKIVKSEMDDRGGRILIELNKPILYREFQYQFVLARPRHEGVRLDENDLSNKTDCSFVGVSDEQASSEDALSLKDWRGGLAFIGDILPEPNHENK